MKGPLVHLGVSAEMSTGAVGKVPPKDLARKFASLPRAAWDRDGDGRVSAEDCRKFLAIAYDIRDEPGRLIRQDNGRIVNYHAIQEWDRDQSGTLSRSEFVTNHWSKKESESIFAKGDSEPIPEPFRELARSVHFERYRLSNVHGGAPVAVSDASKFHQISDSLWERIEPTLPVYKPNCRGDVHVCLYAVL
ncbi:EF hand [Planctomyces sp. SH-PL14]|nr:EF hand [Planctomyces sp. SH-PL14]